MSLNIFTKFSCLLKHLKTESYRLADGNINNELRRLYKLSAVRLCNDATSKDAPSSEHGKSTVAGAVERWSRHFEKEGISEPIESAEHIAAHILGISKITDLVIQHDKQLTPEQLEKLDQLCECRLARMPVQYIIGEWDFRDITLKLEPPILIPRPETEILVDFALRRMGTSKKDLRILEIGCGSGAICLSILHSNNKVNVTAIDANPYACELTLRNAKELKLEDRLIVLNAALKEDGSIEPIKENSRETFNKDKYDFIISNPPYVPTKRIFKLQPEIALYEDIEALDGGEDGLKIIKPILKFASESLETKGFLILEVDSDHPDRIKFLVEKFYSGKLKFEHVHKDYCNRDRFVEISKL